MVVEVLVSGGTASVGTAFVVVGAVVGNGAVVLGAVEVVVDGSSVVGVTVGGGLD